MGIKLDMSKAYDQMEWDFISETLGAFGFHREFTQIVKEFIGSVLYSILLNGSSFGNNIPSRGLRQRDPLSPYLFILGAEVLSRLFIRAEKESLISGIKVAKRAPGISHFFFVDDIFIFTGSIIQEAREIKEILEEYCEVSGQMINFNKSVTSLSKGACRNRCKTIISILGVQYLLDNETYLSNPLNVGRNK